MKLQYSLAAAGLLLFSSVSLMGETAQEQAKRRISPVITQADVNGSVRCLGFRAGETYRIWWNVLGYDNSYSSKMVIFDCGPWYADGTCGASYAAAKSLGTIIYETDKLPLTSTLSGWTYWDQNNNIAEALDHNFSTTFVFPDKRPTYFGGADWNTTAQGANPIVFRWYQIAQGEVVGEPYISIILGTEAGYHYGNNARRIESTVATDVDSAYVCTP